MQVRRWVAISGGLGALAVAAAGLTQVTFAYGPLKLDPAGLKTAWNAASVTATPTPTPVVAPAASATPTAAPVVSTPLVTTRPVATPTPAVAGSTAITNGFVHLRSNNSIYSPILTDLNAGTRVQLLPVSDAQWQKVQYGSVVGYIFKSYLNY